MPYCFEGMHRDCCQFLDNPNTHYECGDFYVREHMTILIVEDNAAVRRLLRRTFADTASAIWECSDGTDALAAYAGYRPDIVLMDIHMPHMDGLAATKQIRQSHPSAKIVIVTDYDDDDLRNAASEAGACGYTLKQDLTDLTRLIHTIANEDQTLK
jgi:CheY-like chemotaxis protein